MVCGRAEYNGLGQDGVNNGSGHVKGVNNLEEFVQKNDVYFFVNGRI